VPVPGDATTTLIQLPPAPGAPPVINNLVAPQVATTFLADIKTAIADNDKANTPGATALPTPPDNFHFTDLTVGVSGTIPGDTFLGTTPGITAQFLDLTPDNLLINSLSPGTFIRSDTGNDLLVADSGRNILSAGSGDNVFLGGTGRDTFLADATTVSTADVFLNFTSGDDLAVLGLNKTDFNFFVADTLNGIEVDALPTNPANKIAASVILPGHTISEIGTKLSLGLSQTADKQSFLFIHGN